jgi:hypothetical protein
MPLSRWGGETPGEPLRLVGTRCRVSGRAVHPANLRGRARPYLVFGSRGSPPWRDRRSPHRLLVKLHHHRFLRVLASLREMSFKPPRRRGAERENWTIVTAETPRRREGKHQSGVKWVAKSRRGGRVRRPARDPSEFIGALQDHRTEWSDTKGRRLAGGSPARTGQWLVPHHPSKQYCGANCISVASQDQGSVGN